MREYHPNDKHEVPWSRGRQGTRLDLTVFEATALLNDPYWCIEVPGKRQLVGVRNGKIYVFQDDNRGGYHAYPSTGNEICAKFSAVSARIASLLGVSVKRLSNMRD